MYCTLWTCCDCAYGRKHKYHTRTSLYFELHCFSEVIHVQAAQQNIPIFIPISEQDWSPIFVVVQDPCGCRHPKCVRAMIE